MSDPHDRSPFDPDPTIRGGDAQRFWQQYRRADSAAFEGGEPGSERGRGPGPGPGNGGPSGHRHEHECLEWCPICRTAEIVRANSSPELREQFQSLQKDALVAVRALLDAYLERIEGAERHRSSPVEDIPIA